MILFCHFATLRPVLGLSKLLVGSNLMLDFVTKHCRLRPVCVNSSPSNITAHGWPSDALMVAHKDPEIEDSFSKQSLLKKNTVFAKLSCCIRRENHRVWVLCIDDLLALNYHFRKLRSHDPSPRIAPRSSGLGYVGWEPKKWERGTWHHRHHLFMHDMLII